MGRELYELAILLSLRDMASAGANRAEAQLRALGKEGRSTLKTFQELREDLNRSMVLGGIGVGALSLMKGGVKVAADFEAAMTDLRMSIAQTGPDGAVALDKLNSQMSEFERLGTRLGNTLPGSTQDFVQLFTALRQGGLSAEAILKGAGEGIADLAVATKNVPVELGRDFAMLAVQFKLKEDEFMPAANLFARVKGAVGLDPSQLIEGAKFAQLRGGLPLGMKGMAGLNSMTNLLGALKMSGLQGGLGGRELAALLFALAPVSKEQKKADAELRKKGIKLEFYSASGDFLGEQHLIKQMEQLRKLSAKERMTLLSKRFASHEAAGPASALMELGAQGYSKYQKTVGSAADVQQRLNMVTANFNTQLENLQGTLSNLTAYSFLPLLESLKPGLQIANQTAGSLQEFAAANQGASKFLGELVGIASIGAVATAAIRGLSAAVKIWKLTSAVSAGEATLAAIVGKPGEVERVLSASGRSWSGTMRGIGIGMGSMLARGFVIGAPLFLFERYLEDIADDKAAEQRAFEAGERLGQMIREGMRKEIEGKLSLDALRELRKIRAPEEAKARAEKLGLDRGVKQVGFFGSPSEIMSALASLDVSKRFRDEKGGPSTLMRAEKGLFSGHYQQMPEPAARELIRGKLQAESLAFPEQLKALLEEAANKFRAAGEPGFIAIMKEEALTVYPQWRGEIEKGGDSMTKLTFGAGEASRALFDLSRTASSNILFPLPYSGRSGPMEPPQKPGKKPAVFPFAKLYPSRAIGGDVQSEGLVHLHAGERILPARVTRGLKSNAAGGITITGGITINVPKGSRAADDPEAFAQYVLNYVTHEVHLMRERR
jgi:TP901 family phage tail tape measure protein